MNNMPPDSSVFTNREHYVMWATIVLMTAADMKTDHAVLQNAIVNAQKAADYFFGKVNQKTANTQGKNPFTDPPEIQPPPQTRTVGPQVPGQRAQVVNVDLKPEQPVP